MYVFKKILDKNNNCIIINRLMGDVFMKKINLGEEKINKLILSFALPCVISMIINSIYNIVDW